MVELLAATLSSGTMKPVWPVYVTSWQTSVVWTRFSPGRVDVAGDDCGGEGELPFEDEVVVVGGTGEVVEVFLDVVGTGEVVLEVVGTGEVVGLVVRLVVGDCDTGNAVPDEIHGFTDGVVVLAPGKLVPLPFDGTNFAFVCVRGAMLLDLERFGKITVVVG